MTLVLLARHGQAMVDTDDYDRLSELGVRQSCVLGEALLARGLVPDIVLHGGMRRQAHTAQLVCEVVGQTLDGGFSPALQVDSDWREFDYRGVLLAHRPDYADRVAMRADLARHPDPVEAFRLVFEQATARWRTGEHEPDYHEPFSALRSRAHAALIRSVEQAGPDGVVLVVTSAGVLAALVADLLGGGPDTWYRINRVLLNAGVTTVLTEPGTPVLLRAFNDHAHLQNHEPGLLTYR